MASKRVFTEDEVEDLISKVLKHKVSDKRSGTKDEELLRKQDSTILRGELAREKKEHVRRVAQDPTATAADKIEALSGDSSLSPLPVLKLHTPADGPDTAEFRRSASPNPRRPSSHDTA